MKILVTGAGGQLGRDLQRSLSLAGEVVAVDRTRLDLCNPAQIREVVRAVQPKVIVNAAAYTAVDLAETERDLAMRINAQAPEILAAEALRLNALLVHYSSDYVFDGTKQTSYTERDATQPVNAYGLSKLRGDEAIAASGCDHVILRSTWLYSASGKNFLTTILRLASQRPVLNVVNDQFGVPTWVRNLSEATLQLILQTGARAQGAPLDSGVYNLTPSGNTNWYEFAKAIVESPLARSLGIECEVRPIASSGYPTPAARPANSLLDNQKFRQRWGFALPDWKVAFLQCIDEMQGIREATPMPAAAQRIAA